MMTTAYEGGTARPAERPSRLRWAPSPGVQALRVRLVRVPAAGALLRGRRRDEYSVQQLTCLVCSIRKEGVHDELLGRRAHVRQAPPPSAGVRLDVRLPVVTQDPLLGLVLAGHPDAARHLADHLREDALDQVRPGAVPGRGHEPEAARDDGWIAPRLRGRTAARGAAARRASWSRSWGRDARGSGPFCGARSGRPPGCRALPVATIASLGWPTASAAFPAWAQGRSLALSSTA